MGKNIVLTYQEMSHRYTSAALVVFIYELSKDGAKDVSHKIFGNIGGENVVLSGEKVYLIGTCISENNNNTLATSVISTCVKEAYAPLWNSQNAAHYERNTFTSILTKRLLRQNKIDRWQKDTTSTNSKAFNFWMFDFGAYGDLSAGIISFISKPDNMSEEDLAEILDIFGGKEDFDIRPFMIDMEEVESLVKNPLLRSHAETPVVLKYLATSKSYILPVPIFISNYQVPGMLHLAKKMLSAGSTMHSFVKDYKKLRLKCDVEGTLYSSLGGTWGKLTSSVLNPEKVAKELFNTRYHVDIPDTVGEVSGFKCILPGERSLFKELEFLTLTGEKKLPVPIKVRDYKAGSVDPRSIPVYSVLSSAQSHIKEILLNCEHSTGTLHLALVEAAIASAHRYLTVLNSSTYLCRDLSKVLNLSMNKKVRWKGSRKEREKLLASRLYALACLYKTPKMLKDLLSNGFLLNASIYRQLPQIGDIFSYLTGRDCITQIPTEKLEQSCSLQEMHPLQARYSLLLREDTEDNYKKVLDCAVDVLKDICKNKRVLDTLEAGIQVVGTKALLVSEIRVKTGTRVLDHSINLLAPYIASKFNCFQGYDTSDSFIEDLYIMLSNSRKKYPELDIRPYVEATLPYIEVLNELRSNIALKSVESYYLNGPLVDYLNNKKWTSLLE